MSWYEKWVLSFLATGLAIIKVNASSFSFREKYASIIRALIDTAEVLKPYLEDKE